MFRPLKHWDVGFEYNSWQGFRLTFFCLCCPVYVAALLRAAHTPKESNPWFLTDSYGKQARRPNMKGGSRSDSSPLGLAAPSCFIFMNFLVSSPKLNRISTLSHNPAVRVLCDRELSTLGMFQTKDEELKLEIIKFMRSSELHKFLKMFKLQ